MPNQYTRLTRENAIRKMNRGVDSIAALAREFGVDTSYRRSNGGYGERAPIAFVNKLKALLTQAEYEQIRQNHKVNLMYR